jgi:hypothetical protein
MSPETFIDTAQDWLSQGDHTLLAFLGLISFILTALFIQKLYFYMAYKHTTASLISEALSRHAKFKLKVSSTNTAMTPFMQREAAIYEAKIIGHLSDVQNYQIGDQPMGGLRNTQEVLLAVYGGPDYLELEDNQGTSAVFKVDHFKSIQNLSIETWQQKKLSDEQRALIKQDFIASDYSSFSLSERWLSQGDTVTCMGQINQETINGLTRFVISPSKMVYKPYFLAFFEDTDQHKIAVKRLIILGSLTSLCAIFWIDHLQFGGDFLQRILTLLNGF